MDKNNILIKLQDDKIVKSNLKIENKKRKREWLKNHWKRFLSRFLTLIKKLDL